MDAKQIEHLKERIAHAKRCLDRVAQLLDAPMSLMEGDCEALHNAYLAAETVEEAAAMAVNAAVAVHGGTVTATQVAYENWLDCESS